MYHDRPVDDGVLPKEAEIGVNEALVPLAHALQTAVLAAEVTNLILIITAHTRRGADRCNTSPSSPRVSSPDVIFAHGKSQGAQAPT